MRVSACVCAVVLLIMCMRAYQNTRSHFLFAQECARRASLAARAIVYGESSLVYKGPEPHHVNVTAVPYDALGKYYVLEVVFDMQGSAGLQHPTVPLSLLSFEVLLIVPNATTSTQLARVQLRRGSDLGGFWVPATMHPSAECIDGGKASVRIGVTAFFDQSAEPAALRYAHGDFPTGILHNVEGLPVAPFLIALNRSH